MMPGRFLGCRNQGSPFVLSPSRPSFWSTESMAPRANWKGFLRLSLVTCPVALYPATSESEKVSFNQLNRKTGYRIKNAKVDADTGEEGGTLKRRAGVVTDDRDRRVRRPQRDRSEVSDPSLLLGA